MRRLGLAAVIALAACSGGGAEFDRAAAVEAMGDKPALFDVAAELCEDTDDDTYGLTMAMLIDEFDLNAITAQAYGCADRYRELAEANDWPTP